MKKTEIILALFCLLAVILRFLEVTGSYLLATVSFMSLAMFYYFSFALFNDIRLRNIFKSMSYAGTNPKRIIGAVFSGLAFSAIITGVLFKLNNWPGGDMQLLTGLICLAVISCVALYFYNQNRSIYYKNIFKRITIIGGIGLLSYYI